MNLPNKTPPLNNQDMLNRVWQHFIVEKHPACETKDGICVYREDEQGCAIGIVLPDNIARGLSGGIGRLLTKPILDKDFDLIEWLKNCTLEFMVALQDWHDSHELKISELIKVSDSYGLIIPADLSTETSPILRRNNKNKKEKQELCKT